MIVCFASLMHILWGVTLLLNHGGLHITATATLYELTGGGSAYLIRAMIYIIAGLLPTILLFRPQWTLGGLFASFPQLILLLLSGISATTAMAAGHYPDGTVPDSPHFFIAMDQGINVILPILYAFEALDRFHDTRTSLAQGGDGHGSTRQMIISHSEGDMRVDARVTVQQKGDKGETGEKGETGKTGKTGEQGKTGERGPTGP